MRGWRASSGWFSVMLKTFRGRSLAWFFSGALALAPRHAHADPSAAELRAAKHAFESAVRLESEQHWPAAELELGKALAVKETPGLHFHLAHCAVEQGHLIEAALEYERVSELLKQGAKAPDVKPLLGSASAAVDRRIPRLVLDLPDDLRNPTVSVDGKPYPPSDLAVGLALNPGPHRLEVGAPGRLPFRLEFVLKEAERQSVRADLEREPAVRPSLPVVSPGQRSSAFVPARAAASEHKDSSSKLYVLLGEGVLTVAGLAVGIAYRAAVSSTNDRIGDAQGRVDSAAAGVEVSNACAMPMAAELTSACSDLGSAIDDHDRDIHLSNIGFVAAGVGAAALLATWLAYPSASKDTAELRVRPTLGLGQVGLIAHF